MSGQYSPHELGRMMRAPDFPSEGALKRAYKWMLDHSWSDYNSGKERVNALISLGKELDSTAV